MCSGRQVCVRACFEPESAWVRVSVIVDGNGEVKDVEVDEALDVDIDRYLISIRVNRGRGGYWLSMLRPAQCKHVGVELGFCLYYKAVSYIRDNKPDAREILSNGTIDKASWFSKYGLSGS